MSERMSQLTPGMADDVLAACGANAAEIASALGRALDREFTVSVGEQAPYPAQGVPYGLEGPGLVVRLIVDGQGLVAALSEESGFLPAWYRAPDPTGASKLGTLAQELSLLLLPESFAADQFTAAAVDDLPRALERGVVAPGAATAKLRLASGEATAQLCLIWPLTQPDDLIAPAAAPGADKKSESFTAGSAPPSMSRPREFSQLPGYSRSLLRIPVPVSVNLAVKKETVQEVVELVPGSIIKFEKGCDELLHMVVGGQTIAEGEAVKIGDKFGFRVTAMVMPEEHFIPVQRPRPV
jgi:flagellar motor switch/type III secretory pathway protein FliN